MSLRRQMQRRQRRQHAPKAPRAAAVMGYIDRLPEELAPRLAAESDPARCAEIVRDAVEDLVDRLADMGQRALGGGA